MEGGLTHGRGPVRRRKARQRITINKQSVRGMHCLQKTLAAPSTSVKLRGAVESDGADDAIIVNADRTPDAESNRQDLRQRPAESARPTCHGPRTLFTSPHQAHLVDVLFVSSSALVCHARVRVWLDLGQQAESMPNLSGHPSIIRSFSILQQWRLAASQQARQGHEHTSSSSEQVAVREGSGSIAPSAPARVAYLVCVS
ncbi:hypothetical protein F4780DRAFT_4517 [Xylariomycetidae sp. FL0641]|nr:hypothetical protein F4780DRAFT_4517 [Xylariomycetidae sp. FL0641]